MDIVIGGTIGLAQVVVGHPLDTVKTMVQNGQGYLHLGARDYYRGCAYPAVASVFFNAIAFPVFERTHKKVGSPYISGFLAGAFVAPVEYIFDVGKIRRQMLVNTPLHLNGITARMLRTTAATCVYFGVYFDTKDTVGPFMAGAAAGLVNWTLTYPLDIISARQIAQNLSIAQAMKAGSLWVGYIPCAIRALLVNGVSFKLYDELDKKRHLF